MTKIIFFLLIPVCRLFLIGIEVKAGSQNNEKIIKARDKCDCSNGSATGGAGAVLPCTDEKTTAKTDVACDDRDPLLIAVMGSSVAYGVGANNNQGYAYKYAQLLEQRHVSGLGDNWSVKNISVGGNNTIDVLNRLSTDLLPICSSYVVYGLSLGNEGIHTGGQPMFDQFRDNMLLLIDTARKMGIEPIIVNCYTRNDFTATDYNFIKQMNLLVHSWDVASVNVLGAVDNGAGQWATGYYNDGYHPNTAGHLEFTYTIVPSLFDAIKAGKGQPKKIHGTYLTLGKMVSDYQLEFVPDATVHPFTLSFDIKTSSSGLIAGFETDKGFGKLSVDSVTGRLNYVSTMSEGIQGTTLLNDDGWHKVTLSHYYAWGYTFLYIDDILQGSIDEKLISKKFVLSSKNSPTASYRDWLFYRSAMNADEVNDLVNDSLLKSSLELYAPLDAQGITDTDTLVNLAQSLNKISKVKAYALTTSTIEQLNLNPLKIFPNPSDDRINMRFSIYKKAFINLTIYNVKGHKVKTLINSCLLPGQYDNTWDVHYGNNIALESGYYLCRLRIDNTTYSKRIVIISQ